MLLGRTVVGSRPGGQREPTAGTVSPWETGNGPACEEQQRVRRDREELFLCLVGALEVRVHLSGSAFADSSAAMVTGFGGGAREKLGWRGLSLLCVRRALGLQVARGTAAGFGSCRVLFDAGGLSQDMRSPSFLPRGVTACGRQGWSQAVGCYWAEFVLKQVKRKAGERRLLALAVPS